MVRGNPSNRIRIGTLESVPRVAKVKKKLERLAGEPEASRIDGPNSNRQPPPMKIPLIVFVMVLALGFGMSAPPAAENWKTVEADFQSIASALKTYKTIGGSYPSTDQGLLALVERSKVAPKPRRWAQLFRKEPLDPWGRKYEYREEKGKYRLWSKGPDPKDPKDDLKYVPPKKKEKPKKKSI
jgi:general secretion pathway protein G